MFLEMEVDEVHHIATLMVSYLFYIDGLPSDLFDMWSSCSMCILSCMAWILFGANRTPPFIPWSKKECVVRDSVCGVMSFDFSHFPI